MFNYHLGWSILYMSGLHAGNNLRNLQKEIITAELLSREYNVNLLNIQVDLLHWCDTNYRIFIYYTNEQDQMKFLFKGLFRKFHVLLFSLGVVWYNDWKHENSFFVLFLCILPFYWVRVTENLPSFRTEAPHYWQHFMIKLTNAKKERIVIVTFLF